MKPTRSNLLLLLCLPILFNNKEELLLTLHIITMSLSAITMVMFIFLITMISQRELLLYTSQENGVKLWFIPQMVIS